MHGGSLLQIARGELELVVVVGVEILVLLLFHRKVKRGTKLKVLFINYKDTKI